MGRLTDPAGGDYSGARPEPPWYRPHDLVTIAPAALGADTPTWARAVVARGEPAVVRRGRRDATNLPVGIRGASRDRRHALRAARHTLLGEAITPESLIGVTRACESPIPALAALPELHAAMTPWQGAWGIGGAVGYQLATGAPACHADSDIDLILRAPAPVARDELQELADRLAGLPVRCDVQLETPAGGVALADWLSPAREVLIKSDQGPYLAADPWLAVAGGAS